MDIVCDTLAMCQALISWNPCNSPVRGVYDSPPDTAIHSLNFLSSYDVAGRKLWGYDREAKGQNPCAHGAYVLIGEPASQQERVHHHVAK